MSQIGPSLPPHLQKRRESSGDSDDAACYGPKLPISHEPPSGDSGSDSDDYGPALPPHMAGNKQESGIGQRLLGPTLPMGFRPDPAVLLDGGEDSDESDDDDIIGPRLPTEGVSSAASAAAEIEDRSRRMKDKLEGRDKVVEPTRETWMLELPSDKTKSFGLGPRQFSRKGHLGPEKGGDRSIWTDTPEERERKNREGVVTGAAAIEEQPVDVLVQKRDRKMEEVTNELNKKRGTASLQDLHTKKLKKKAKKDKEEGINQERRPFDRDVDLSANKFDEAQRKAMLKKSGNLNDRYASGAQKFL